MTQSLSDFEQELGRELRAAAHRRLQGRRSNLPTRRWTPIALTAAAIAAVLVAAAFTYSGFRPWQTTSRGSSSRCPRLPSS